jgi:antitoxin PrlF
LPRSEGVTQSYLALLDAWAEQSRTTDRHVAAKYEVRKALHLSKREKIRYTIQPDGNVLLSRADAEESDPALGNFLRFLADDIQHNPHHVKVVTPELASRIQNLVGDIDIDLDAPLADEDE